MITRSLTVVALLFATGGLVAPQAGASRAQADRTCQDYIPTDLALNVPSAAPGQTIMISGLAYPGDTVTIRIATFGGFPIVLATATAAADGRFSASITVPANFNEGTYNITVSSPNCSGSAVISLVVRQPGGRCTDRRTITAQRGATVEWELLGVLDRTKPLKVTLDPIGGGSPVVIFDGAYPADGKVTFVVPATLVNGRYRIVEAGTGRNGRPRSARCGRLRVRGGAAGTTTTTSSTTSSTTSTSTSTSTTSTTVPDTSSTSTTSTSTSTTTTTAPAGTCDSPIVVNFIATQLIDWTKSFPGLGYADVAYTRVTEVALPAGTWNITNVISRDGYDTRIYTGVQLSEIWEIEFLGSDGSVLARSNPTGDVPDGIAYGEWIGDLGTVTLPEGVVAVRGHHLPDLVPEDPETANSVMPITFTICSDDGSLNTSSTTTPGSTTTVSSTTPGSTSTVSSTIPSSTPQPTVTSAPGSTAPLVSSATTVPGRGVGSGVLNSGATNNPPKTTNVGVNLLGSEIPAQVLGTSVNSGSLNSGTTSTSNSNLAITGSTVRPLIVAAISLIALGGLLALGARRRRD